MALAAAFATQLSAQRIEAGIKAGVPITESFETGVFMHISFGEIGESAARRFTGGPAAVVHVGGRFGFEFDALYQRIGFDRTDKSGQVFYTFTSGAANSWEFPLLARAAVLRRLYVSAGPSFRTVSGVAVSFLRMNPIEKPSGGRSSQDFTFDNRSHFGGVAAVGLRVRAGPVWLSPEIRYTRWREDALLDPYLHSQQNQVVFLLGITR